MCVSCAVYLSPSAAPPILLLLPFVSYAFFFMAATACRSSSQHIIFLICGGEAFWLALYLEAAEDVAQPAARLLVNVDSDVAIGDEGDVLGFQVVSVGIGLVFRERAGPGGVGHGDRVTARRVHLMTYVYIAAGPPAFFWLLCLLLPTERGQPAGLVRRFQNAPFFGNF